MTASIAVVAILPLSNPLTSPPTPLLKREGRKTRRSAFLVYGFDSDIVVVNGIGIEKGDLKEEGRSLL